MFKKGQKVTWIIDIIGSKTRCSRIVSKVTKSKVVLEGEESLSFNPKTGEEINPSIKGCSSKITYKGFKPVKKEKLRKKVVKKKATKVVKEKMFKFPKGEKAQDVVDSLNKFYNKEYFKLSKYSDYGHYDPNDPDECEDFTVIHVSYDFLSKHNDGDTYGLYPDKKFCDLMNKSKEWFIEVINMEQIAIFPS